MRSHPQADDSRLKDKECENKTLGEQLGYSMRKAQAMISDQENVHRVENHVGI